LQHATKILFIQEKHQAMWGTKPKPMGNLKKLEAAIKKVLSFDLQ
jgi:hypothetical protein